MSETVRHLTADEKRIFDLNMTKLATILPMMDLTVDERRTLEELLETYFQRKPPPPLPWVQRDHARAFRQRNKGD
jgi:hypothetical protein